MRRTTRRKVDHSTIAKDDYIIFLEAVAYTGSVVVYFANFLLAGCMSSKQEYLNAFIFVWIAAGLTYFLTRNCRTRMQGFSGTLIGISGYTLFIYWDNFSRMCAAFVHISLMIIAVDIILYFIVGKRKKQSILSYFISRIFDSLYLSRIIIAGIGLTACLALPVFNHLQVNSLDGMAENSTISSTFSEEEYRVNPIYGDEYRLGLNIERIKPAVDEEEWESLSLAERQDTVVAIIECEARYLGIPYKIDIQFSDDMDYENKGYYSHSEHLICINNDGLRKDGGEAAMLTAIHEVRHCYQEALCETYAKLTPEERNLYCFSGVDKWCENINNYVDAEENYYAYRYQVMEADSRRYSQESSAVYAREIENLLDQEGQ